MFTRARVGSGDTIFDTQNDIAHHSAHGMLLHTSVQKRRPDPIERHDKKTAQLLKLQKFTTRLKADILTVPYLHVAFIDRLLPGVLKKQ